MMIEKLERRRLLSGSQIFVTNDNGPVATIGEYSTSGATMNASLVSGLSAAYGIAVSGSDMFVTNINNGTIGEYTTSGATVNASLISGLNFPQCIAVSGSDLFVTNCISGTIGEYTTSGATVNASLVSGLNTPFGIAASGSDLFVENEGGATIAEYTTSGATVNASLISGLGGSRGIAVSGSDLFVSIFGSDTIGEYTTSGGTVNPSLVSGLNTPFGIAVSGPDLFVANYGGTIGEYTTSGATVNASLVSGLVGPEYLALPASTTNQLAFIEAPTSTTTTGTLAPVTVDLEDSSGALLASDNSNVTLAIVSGPSGAALGGTTTVAAVNGVATFSDLSIRTPGANYTLSATDGALASATTALFNITLSGGQIFVANDDGTIGNYTISGATANASLISGLGGAVGIAVSGSDLFIAYGGGTIGEYATSGATVNASLVSGLDGPYGIALSGSDLFVTNNNDTTIGEYTTSGATVNASLVPGGLRYYPAGIAVSGADLFVTSNNNGHGLGTTIGEYTTSGATVNAALISGLVGPVGIAVSGSNLFVLNEGTGTIGEYTMSGATVNASLVSGLSYPAAIAVCGSDLFVTNDNGTIGEYTTSGATVNASLISGLKFPQGIAVVTSTTNQLAFVQAPASATTTGTLAPVTVDVEDSSGILLANDTSNVTLAIASGPSGAALGGTTTVAAIDGVATFTDLSITTAADNYTLTATDGALTTATSSGFTITASPIALTLGNVVLPSFAVAGGKFKGKIPVILTNGGNKLQGTYRINLFADPEASLDSNKVSVATVSKSLSLNAGKSKTININFQSLPSDLPDGTYYLLAQVDDPTGNANVVASAQTITVAAPSISLASSAGPVAPPGIIIGNWGTVVVAITNDGNVAASGPIDLTLSPSSDGVAPWPGTTPLTVTKNTAIKPGETKTFKLRFNVSMLVAGNYYPVISISLDGETTTAVGQQFTVD